MAVFGLLLALLSWATAFGGTLTVDVLDIGQGDAILVRTPAGKSVLIDAGDGKIDVAPLLRERGVEQLDLVVGTHPHADHIGGMQEVVEALPVRNYTDNGLPHTTQTYDKLMAAIEAREIPYRAAQDGQVYDLDDGARLDVLFPAEAPLQNTRSDLNANSVVIRLTHQGHCMLLVGDAEAPTEDALVTRGLGPCEVLKVAHHGSNHSSTPRFLDAVKPRYALVSVGEGNRYGHPGEETMERLHAAGVTVYRTDLGGTITVLSSEDGLEIRTAREGAAPLVAVAPDAPPEARAASAPADLELAATDEMPAAACPFPGSARSEVFHEAGCGNARKIAPSNLVCYASAEAARAADRRPAGCCKP